MLDKKILGQKRQADSFVLNLCKWLISVGFWVTNEYLRYSPLAKAVHFSLTP